MEELRDAIEDALILANQAIVGHAPFRSKKTSDKSPEENITRVRGLLWNAIRLVEATAQEYE